MQIISKVAYETGYNQELLLDYCEEALGLLLRILMSCLTLGCIGKAPRLAACGLIGE